MRNTIDKRLLTFWNDLNENQVTNDKYLVFCGECYLYCDCERSCDYLAGPNRQDQTGLVIEC